LINILASIINKNHKMGSNLCLYRDNNKGHNSDLFGCKSNLNFKDINTIYYHPADIYKNKKRNRHRNIKKFE